VLDVEVELDPSIDYVEFTINFKGCGAELANIVKTLTPAELGVDDMELKTCS